MVAQVDRSRHERLLAISSLDFLDSAIEIELSGQRDGSQYSEVFHTEFDRKFGLLSFLGEDLSDIEVRSGGETLVLGRDFRILGDRFAQVYFIEFLGSIPDEVEVACYFSPREATSIQDARKGGQLANLSPAAVERHIRMSAEAGFEVASLRLQALLDRRRDEGAGVSVYDVEKVLVESARYTYRQAGDFDENIFGNIWSENARFCRRGRLQAQCDTGNKIGAEVVEDMLSSTSWQVRNRKVFSVPAYSSKVRELDLHLISEIYSSPDQVFLDFTPAGGFQLFGWAGGDSRTRSDANRGAPLISAPNPQMALQAIETFLMQFSWGRRILEGNSQGAGEGVEPGEREAARELRNVADNLDSVDRSARDLTVDLQPHVAVITRAMDRANRSGWVRFEIGEQVMVLKLALQALDKGDSEQAARHLGRFGPVEDRSPEALWRRLLSESEQAGPKLRRRVAIPDAFYGNEEVADALEAILGVVSREANAAIYRVSFDVPCDHIYEAVLAD